MKLEYLPSLVTLLEENGFHVTRIFEETYKDIGNADPGYQYEETGAICLRVIPNEQ